MREMGEIAKLVSFHLQLELKTDSRSRLSGKMRPTPRFRWQFQDCFRDSHFSTYNGIFIKFVTRMK